jgi:DNA adenine methylase
MSLAPRNPALRYYGAKWRLASWIAQYFPPHITYVEPFGGAAGVLLRKPLSPVEVYNDLDSGVFNFFKVLRERRRDLLQALKNTPYSRQEFQNAFLDSDPVDDMERARRFFISSWQGFGGARDTMTGWKRQKTLWINNARINQMGEWRGAVRNLGRVADRLRKVQLEHDDALKVIQFFDTPETLFYCDPPYPKDTRNRNWANRAYAHEFTPHDHVHLANALNQIKGLALVSTYPNEHYSELFAGWPSVTTTCQTMNKTVATEQLYISPRAYKLLGLPETER